MLPFGENIILPVVEDIVLPFGEEVEFLRLIRQIL